MTCPPKLAERRRRRSNPWRRKRRYGLLRRFTPRHDGRLFDNSIRLRADVTRLTVRSKLRPVGNSTRRFAPPANARSLASTGNGMKKPEERILYGARRPDGSTPFWRMPTIWAMADGRPSTPIEIEKLNILDEVVWFGGPNNVQPTVSSVARHARDIFDADLSYPIIMTSSGDVLDGAHRIAKAYLTGQQVISAVVVDHWPPPDGMIDTVK